MSDGREALKERPVLRIPRTRTEIALEVAAGLGVLFFVWVFLTYWPRLPEQVPRHFNARGEADAWGSRSTVFLLPGMSLVLYAGLSLLSRYPHRCNLPFRLTRENAETQYRCVRTMIISLKGVIVWSFAYIAWRTACVATGSGTGLGPLFLPVFLFATIGPIGVYLWLAHRAR